MDHVSDCLTVWLWFLGSSVLQSQDRVLMTGHDADAMCMAQVLGPGPGPFDEMKEGRGRREAY